ncbi:CHAP domain-containing protein [Nonomuraea glycinis]|uniref:CHAP domain-containing protein n=1 Tax=Nonomuraea glycinis TaxID=2047744 RepID=UPI002E117CAB|nr:CHAP domain-containing protein [Nonomuraea glycinis]
MKKFIDLLESELGYAEKASAYTKFGSWYGKNVEFDADYTHAPWCDMFLSWAAHKLGYEEWMGQFAWTVAHAKWFKKQDAWGTKPVPGAFVFYDWSGSDSISRIDHVGIVTRVEGGRIFTIEGNIDGGVAKRKERDTSKVVGYGYPWKIKERLDAKESMRDGYYSADHPGSTKPGTLQLPDELRPEIPFLETEQDAKVLLSAPKDTAKKKSEQAQAEAPAPEPSPKIEISTPASGTISAPAVPKSGKHAKHSAADTSAVTTGPIPVITDVAAPTPPSAALGSPAILTSALVATLAMLAITKTRRLRLRPALAAPAPAPAHRRRRKGATPRRAATERPPRRNAVELTGPHRPLLDAAEPVGALRSLKDTVVPAFETIVIPEATSAFNAFTRAQPMAGSLATSEGMDLASFPRRLESTGPIGRFTHLPQASTGAAPRTRHFEPFPLAPRTPARPESHTGHTTSGFEPFPHTGHSAGDFEPFPRAGRGTGNPEPFPHTGHSIGGFEPFSRTGRGTGDFEPFSRPRHTTHGGESVPHNRHATNGGESSPRTRHASSGFEAFSRTPGAASEFDAFTPFAASARGGATGSTPRREHPSGAYCGRRRGREHPAEELTGFAVIASPRGRRHRSTSPTAARPTHSPDPSMAMAGASLSENWSPPFDDATPNHASSQPSHPQAPHPQTSTHGTRRPGSRQGRHRA